MQIHGKSLTEIFGMLPFAYKMVVIIGTCFFLFAMPYSLHFFFTAGIIKQVVEPLKFPLLDTQNIGVLDPAIATDGDQVIMAHTMIGANIVDGQKRIAPQIVLERSTPGCRSWITVSSAGFEPKQEPVYYPDAVTEVDKGTWVAETPSIVYDPEDKGREWKIFAYRYFWTGNHANTIGIAKYYNYISMRTAAQPQGPWSPEEWMLSANAQRPPVPYDKFVMHHINDLNASLSGMYFYSRPSVVNLKGALFMSLSAFKEQTDQLPDRVILLASADHGKNWGYLGTPLTLADAKLVGDYNKLAGGSLIVKDGRLIFAAVFGDKKSEGQGTFLINFADPLKAQLERDEKTGAPVVFKHLERNSVAASPTGGGFAAYTSLCKQGLFVSEFSEVTKSFQIFKTWKQPDND